MNHKLFNVKTVDTAPEASRPILEGILKAFGFVPNLMGTFANAPAVLKGYMALDAEWEKSTFSAKERQLVLLAASLENECGYCTAAHSTIAKAFLGVSPEVVAAVRENRSTDDEKTDALVTLTREIVGQRGYVSKSTLDRFLAAGFNDEQVMELLLGVALKTISNYLDHLNPAELDAAFAGEAVVK
jgi:uncharacterized peroxidase-related enzyme